MDTPLVRKYLLPASILLGLLFHGFLERLAPLTPWLILLILLLSLTKVDILMMRPRRIHLVLLLFQALSPMAGYLVLVFLDAGQVLSQAALIGLLCPVAAAAVVVSVRLGARRDTVSLHTILSNLMVTALAPLYFSLVGTNRSLDFLESFLGILGRVSSVLALPLAAAFLMERFHLDGLRRGLRRLDAVTFPLWATVLMINLGTTLGTMLRHLDKDLGTVTGLALMALALCLALFLGGKRIGRRFGEAAAAGQLLGQKNTAIGIWLSSNYLEPLVMVYFTFYIIFQNLFNAVQLLLVREHPKEAPGP